MTSLHSLQVPKCHYELEKSMRRPEHKTQASLRDVRNHDTGLFPARCAKFVPSVQNAPGRLPQILNQLWRVSHHPVENKLPRVRKLPSPVPGGQHKENIAKAERDGHTL